MALMTGLITAVAAANPGRAAAATGDLVGQITFSQVCSSGVGVGITYDGSSLWYSCYSQSPDLFRANPVTGQVTGSWTIDGGLGALAYDAGRNAIWAGWGGPNAGNIWLIRLDQNHSVVSSSVAFSTCSQSCGEGIDDGLAYDASDDSLYFSPDTSTTIYHYTTSGSLRGSFPWAGNSCYNSGVGLGGNDLYEGSDGCNTIWVVDKSNPSVVLFSFATGGVRDESLTCDPNTFAPQGDTVMWSKEAYSAVAYAFQIPTGSCGIGGTTAGMPIGGPLTTTEQTTSANLTELSDVQCQQGASPVNCATGDFWHTFNDFSVPGRGLALNLSRTYNSLEAATSGPFGYGWSSTYTMGLSTDLSGNVTIRQEDGSTVVFNPNGTGGYTAAPRVLATLVKNADGSYTFTRRHRSMFKFSSAGQLLAESDLNGYTTSLAYNSSGQLTTVTDPAGRTLTFTYGSNNLISSVVDPAGRNIVYGYDNSGNLTSVIDAAQRTWTFGYDANHLLLTMADPRGGVVTNTYDSSARVLQQSDPLGRITAFSYSGSNMSAAGGTTTITDPHGSITVENYSYGELDQITHASGTPAAATWSYGYDSATLGVAMATDPNGHTTIHTYDSDGNLISSEDPLQQRTTATYDGIDDLTSVTDPTGVTTSYSYDASGNPLTKTVTGAGGSPVATTTYTYGDSAHPGDVTEVADPAGHLTDYTYSANGDTVSSSTHPSATVTDTTSAVYDIIGRRVCEASPNAVAAGTTCPAAGDPRVAGTTTWVYDADSEVTSTTDASGATTNYVYDPEGNQTQMTDPLGNITLTAYDADNRKTAVTSGSGTASAATTSYSYDLAPGTGACSASITGAAYCDTTTSPLGAVTVDYFDVQNRQIEDAPPAPIGPTANTFDPAGNLLTKQTPSGLTTYGYDADNHLTSVSYSNAGSGFRAASNVTYSYDPAGRRTAMTDGSGTTTYRYDPLGRLASWTNGAGATVGYGYDLDGNLTTLTYPGGQQVTRTYDNAGEWTGVTDWQGHTNGFGYDHDGNLTTEGLANGLTSTSSFDTADRVLSTNDAPASAPGSPLDSISYIRDAAGQLTNETDTTCPGGSGCGQSYTYDPLNRVTSQGTGSYSYDSGSDLTGWPGGISQAFNNANQVLSSTTPVSTVGYNSYSYNAGVTTVPVSLPAGIQALDQIVLAISEANTQTATTPAGYVAVGTFGSSAAGSQRIQVFRRTAAGGETSVTIGFSNGNVSGPTSIAIGVYRGLNPANPLDAISSASVQSSNTVTAPSVTASLPGDELVMFTGNSYPTSTTFQAPPGMTSESGFTPGNGNVSLDDELLTNAGPTGPKTGSYLNGLAPPSSVAVLVALKPSVTTYTYDTSGGRSSDVTPLATHQMTYDQAGRLIGYDNTSYAYNGDGLRTSKTVSGAAENFTWDISSSQPLLLQDGSINYVDGPGGLPLEQVGAPTITLVGSGANDETVTGGAKNSITVNFSAKAAPNDQILIAVTENDTTTASIPGYTFVTAVNNVNGATNDKLELWRRTATGGELSATVSVDKTDHTKAVVAAIYRGVDPSNPVDAFDASFNALASTSVTVPSVSASEANDELVMLQSALDNTSSATWIAPSGMIERQQETTDLVSAAFADQPLPAAGATGSRTTSLNLGGSASLSAVVVALRPQTIYYLHDQRGTTRFLTDQAGNMLASYFDGPYGYNPASAGPQALLAANPFRLEGAYTDQESGLDYLINRYYDPTTAQFLSIDPLVGITQQAYNFAGDDPVNKSDPSGLCGGNPPPNFATLPPPEGFFQTIAACPYGPLTPAEAWNAGEPFSYYVWQAESVLQYAQHAYDYNTLVCNAARVIQSYAQQAAQAASAPQYSDSSPPLWQNNGWYQMYQWATGVENSTGYQSGETTQWWASFGGAAKSFLSWLSGFITSE